MSHPLPHTLERTVRIHAAPATVFSYFTDTARWASWWGAGSTVDPIPGGKIVIRYPGGIEVAGKVVEIVPSSRFTFTYGYRSGDPFPPGSSLVTIELQEAPDGTVLHLTHAFAETAARDHHVQGWRYQMAVFANVVTDHLFHDAAERIDAWFAAWSEPDAAARERLLDGAVVDGVLFRDRFSLVEGRADLDPHLAAVHQFMPGMTLTRQGMVRHCQATVLADWVAAGPDGAEQGRGTNVFGFAPSGMIESVIGFWETGRV